jgi:Rhs element Vgr protein
MTRLLPIEQHTDVVSLTVEIAGTELPGWVAVAQVEVVREVNRIPFARLKIGDGDSGLADFSASADTYFVPGQEIVISAGYHGETEAIFAGIVLKQHIGLRPDMSWLDVECRDVAATMTLARRNRHFEDVTDSDAIATIIADYDLQADLAETSATHGQLLQYHATDWDFIVSRLDANGQFCAVEDGTLRSFVPELDSEPTAELVFGTNLIELDAEFDARLPSGRITAQSWDPAAQDLAEAEAADPGLAPLGDLTADDMITASGRTAEEAWHGGMLAGDALQAWADGALRRSRIAGARGRARFQGFAGVGLGKTIKLGGLGNRFNGSAIVTGIRHVLVDNGWTTDLEFGIWPELHAERFAISAPPAAGLAPAVSGLQIGVVTATAGDPQSENRVRIKVPTAGLSEEGIWARLAMLDAGDGRGSYFWPEVDDEVVVGFLHDDPAHPVILGALHSSAHAPPEAPTEDNNLKGFVTRSGLTLAFDDDTAAMTLKTPEGNSLVLSDGDGGIVLKDQNGNSIEMTASGITLKSAGALKIEAKSDVTAEGANIGLKAQAELKAEGSASAALKSSGLLEISGALVTIN